MRPVKGLFAALVGAALYAGGGGSAYADVVAPSPSICPITPPPIESGSTPTYPGRFWNPNRYGTGWDFLYDDRLGMNGLFVLYWFTFDAGGRPTWLIAWPSEVTSTDGHKRFAGKLKKAWWDGTKVSQVTDVGSVAVTIPNGTSTRAAVTWQWNEAGAGNQTECLYDYFRDTVPPVGRADTLNQAFTANWFDDALVATQPGSAGSWGFDLVIGIDSAQKYTKIITPQIFDTSGNPVWLQSKYSYGASIAPPKDNRSPDPNQPTGDGKLSYIKKATAGVPITDCSTASCVLETDLAAGVAYPANRFLHVFGGVNDAKIQMQADVSGTVTDGAPIDWPTVGLPPRYEQTVPAVNVSRTTDVDRLVTDRTLCYVQQAGTNCSLIVSYTASQRTTTIYRFDLNAPLSQPVAVRANAGLEDTFTESLPIGSRVKYKLYAQATSPANGDEPLSESSEVRVIGFVNVADQPLVSLAGDLPAHDATVGTLAGEAGVSGGASTYSIPITVPPGRNGMQPDIGLSYSSRGGNGVAGMGFSLSGLSSIHRCPRTKAQDNGVDRPVRLDGGDALCLDGQRLMALNGQPYGQASTTYRTEIDNYAKVTQYGGPLTGDATCFVVETKSGRVMHYGATYQNGCSATGTARVKPAGAPATLTWLVTKTEDRANNAMTYTYDTGGGTQSELLIRSIDYTLPTASNARRVTFDYEARSTNSASNDNSVSALAGGLSSQARRLNLITTWVGATKVRDYTLKYSKVDGQPDVSQYSGRSLLQRVTECGYDDNGATKKCHPATTFDWNDGPIEGKDKFSRLAAASGLVQPVLPTPAQLEEAFYASQANLPASPDTPDTSVIPQSENSAAIVSFQVIGDLNGDGTREVLARRSLGGDLSTYQILRSTADRRLVDPVTVGQDVLFGVEGGDDFNGDGYSEGIGGPGGTSSGFLRLVRWKKPRGYWPTSSSETFSSLFDTLQTNIPFTYGKDTIENTSDFNGDGRPDVLVRKFNGTTPCASTQGQLVIWLNTITPTSSATFTQSATACLSRAPKPSTDGESVFRVADLDGDGRADIMISTNDGTDRIVKVLTPTSTGASDLTLTEIAASTLGLGTETTLSQTGADHWMDINGDGLVDLLFARTDAGVWKVHLNRGNFKFTDVITVSTSADVGLAVRLGGGYRYAASLPQVDVDGDGRPELLRPSRIAAMLCPEYKEMECTNDPGSSCDTYACPVDPATGARPFDNNNTSLGGYARNLYDSAHGGAIADPSGYYMNAVKFLIGPLSPTTGLPSITAIDMPTSIVATLNGTTSSGDVYGDGLADVIATIACSGCAVANNQAAFLLPTHLPNGEPVGNLQSAVYSTFINENNGATRSTESRVGLSPRLPELLDVATNGLGDEATWDYFPLSSNAGRAVGDLPLYKTVLDPATSYADADHFYFTSSMPVVSSMYRSNGLPSDPFGGIFGFRSARYSYEEAMYNARGRGMQGFRKITQDNEVTGTESGRRLRTETVFEQKFPFTGLVKEMSTYRTTAAAPGTFELIKKETNGWSDRIALESSAIHQMVVFENVVESYETAGVCAGAISKTQSTFALFDAYGSPRGTNVIYSESNGNVACPRFIQNQNVTTINTYESTDSPWWPSRLTSANATSTVTYQSTHALPSGVTTPLATVKTTYGWDLATRTPTSVVKTADNGTLVQSTVSTYSSANHYGLPDSVTTSANDMSPRTASFTYSPDRYFVATTTNPLNYTASVQTRPRDGAASQTIDERGLKTMLEYDAFGFLVRTSKFKPGNVPLEPPTNVAVTRCISQTDCGAPTGNNGGGQRDAAYRATSVKDGAPTQAVWYDLLGREVKRATRSYDPSETVADLTKPWMMSFTNYDRMGTILQQSTLHCPNASDLCALSAPRWIVFAYDAMGRVLSKRAPGPTTTSGAATTLRTTYQYSAGETRIQNGPDWADGASCPDCRILYRYSDVVGQLAKTVDAAGKATRFWHDVGNKPVAIVDAKGSLIRAEYNAFGQRTKSVDPNQGTWTFTYDGSGKVLSQTDARNIVTTFGYDGLGRMTMRQSIQSGAQGASLEDCQNSEATLDSWVYNDAFAPLGTMESLSRQITKNYGACNGLPVRTTTAVPWKESYRYDDASRVEKITTSIIEVDGQTAQDFDTDVQYDQTYNREKVRRYPSGLRVQSTYTVYGMPHRTRDADLQQDYLTVDRRDNWGNISQQTYGNFAAGLFTSNPGTGQSQQRLWKNGGPNGVEVDRLDYAYDVFGNLGSQTRSYPDSGTIPGSSRTETYTYDTLHRLTRAFSGTSEPIYGAVDYAYDDVGNLLSKTDYSDALGSGPSTPYQYTSSKPNAVTSVTRNGVPLNYSYDANGNLTGGAVQGAYDTQNLPRKLVRNGSTILFDYTPNGDRYRERKAGFPAKLTLPNGLERLSATNFQHELGEVSVRRDQYGQTVYESTNKIYYNYQDRLGSTSTMADGNGVVLPRGRMVFDAFGMAREANFMARYRVGPSDATIGSLLLNGITDRGFTGHQHLDTLQLIHMNGRAYDFRLGRFLSVDPVIQFPANSQSLNPYSYVLNNPLSGTDPTGYQSQSCSKTNASDVETGDTCTYMSHDNRSANKMGEMTTATLVVKAPQAIPVTLGVSAGSHGEPAYVCIKCVSSNGASNQGTIPAAQADGAKGGAPDIENATHTPGQEWNGKVAEGGRRAADGLTVVAEAVNPADPVNLALGAVGRLLGIAGRGVARGAAFSLRHFDDDMRLINAVEDAGAAGAGGGWKVSGEVFDSAVEKQLSGVSCGNACGKMLLESRGIRGISQESLGNMTRPIDEDILASRLNRASSHTQWIGGVTTRSYFNMLNLGGSWAAKMKNPWSNNLHWVVVDGVNDAGRVKIRDPWEGSRYLMEKNDFFESWTGGAVYRK